MDKHQCYVRVQVVKSESESSPPSPSHHLKIRVRVQQIFRVRVTNLVSSSPHIQHLFIFQNMKTNNNMYRMSE